MNEEYLKLRNHIGVLHSMLTSSKHRFTQEEVDSLEFALNTLDNIREKDFPNGANTK